MVDQVVKDGRVPDGTGLSQVEPASGLQPTAFDPSRITEAVSAIDAKLLEPIIKKAADEFYCTVLEAAQDYLKENLDYNLRSHLEMLESENQRMRTELWDVDRMLEGRPLVSGTRLHAIALISENAAAYREALFTVAIKCEGETRHETMLRHLRNAASGMSASGQDPKGLEAKPASPVGASRDAHPGAGQ